ncbi:MAG: hypothetical protein OK457_08210 [Thaumarchaeota archaeon]|nr:hypothetical protein [Nitrososphaerota archaeon]
MSKNRYSVFLTLGVMLLLTVGISGLAISSSAASCQLTKVWISQSLLYANTVKVQITATPSCWSGAVDVNRGNADVHVITVQVTHGSGSGIVPRLELSSPCSVYCVHPYATNPGLRGNNLVVPAN